MRPLFVTEKRLGGKGVERREGVECRVEGAENVYSAPARVNTVREKELRGPRKPVRGLRCVALCLSFLRKVYFGRILMGRRGL